MSACVIADALGLVDLWAACDSSPSKRLALLVALTELVEDQVLRFPKEIADELAVVDRGGHLASWAAGLGSHLNSFNANYKYNLPLMQYAKELGFEEGFQSLDGKDPAVVAAGRLACEYSATAVEFAILTGDLGKAPLRPTMEQLCDHAGWTVIDISSVQTLFDIS